MDPYTPLPVRCTLYLCTSRRYLTGTGVWVWVPSVAGKERCPCSGGITQALGDPQARAPPCKIRYMYTVCTSQGVVRDTLCPSAPVRYTLCRTHTVCIYVWGVCTHAPLPVRYATCVRCVPHREGCVQGVYHVFHPFNTSCVPLNHSSNPGVNVPHREGSGTCRHSGSAERDVGYPRCLRIRH